MFTWKIWWFFHNNFFFGCKLTTMLLLQCVGEHVSPFKWSIVFMIMPKVHHQRKNCLYQSYYIYLLISKYHCIPIPYFQFYISSIYIYIYHILKCFDVVMYMVSKFWKTLYTNTKLISQSGDTRPTLVQISFWPKWWASMGGKGGQGKRPNFL